VTDEIKLAIFISVLVVVILQLIIFWGSAEYKVKKITRPEDKLEDVKNILITKRITAKNEIDVERAKMLLAALSDLSNNITEYMIDTETKMYKEKVLTQSKQQKQQKTSEQATSPEIESHADTVDVSPVD